MQNFVFKAYMALLMLLAHTSGAQITITADNVPSPGTNFIKGIDDLPVGINPGTPGAGKVWDFSILIPDNTIGYNYVNPESTPYPDYFPEANLALHSSDTAYSYLFFDDDQYVMQGLVMNYEGQEYAFDYTPDLTLFTFPFTFGDQILQDYYFEWIYTENEDSVKFKDHVTRSVDVDAFGTVLLPSGSYNALRATVNQLNKDSIWTQILGNWMLISVTVTESNYYDWYTNDPEVDISLVSFKYDETWTVLESAEYFKDSFTGIDAAFANGKIAVYPNPSTDQIFIETNGINGCIAKFYDLQGKSVLEQIIKSEKEEIDIKNLVPGAYLCRIFGKDSHVLYNGKILVK